ncbi:alpha/beta fold hydrolase [Butyrivibrio sp. AE3004]|uniref:alpha/beta fold hydrolase n=1 Tax=Butyrivibrio sp. AE3004 TaxID=1506994 RepID=UPI00068D3725|nr:alpha/beta hydrolase [Butyrivibrio sp. AE3004]
MSIKIQTVTTNNIVMNYFRFGKEGGYPIVIIPGLSIKSVMDSADFIAAAYKIFAEEFDVYVMDRRQNLPDKYAIEDMANDTIEVIKALGLKNINIISTSQGGMISMTIALKCPELINNLVVESSSSHMNEKSLAVIGKWIELAKSGESEALMLEFADKCYTADYVNKYRDAFKKLATLVTDEDLKRFVIIAEGIFDFDISDRIQNIKNRALIIGADKDLVFGKEPSLEIAEKIGCESYIYEDYGHALYDEAPDCCERIYKFMKAGV